MMSLQFSVVSSYARAATRHWEAADLILAHCPRRSSGGLPTEAVYLMGYVVECALKAVLLSHIPPKQHNQWGVKLKKDLGHSLEVIRRAVRERGVLIPTAVNTSIQRVASVWVPEMRYATMRIEYDDAVGLHRETERILQWARGGSRGAT